MGFCDFDQKGGGMKVSDEDWKRIIERMNEPPEPPKRIVSMAEYQAIQAMSAEGKLGEYGQPRNEEELSELQRRIKELSK